MQETTDDRGYQSRKAENMRISQENVEIYDRIRKAVGLYSAAAMEQDWRENRRKLKNDK